MAKLQKKFQIWIVLPHIYKRNVIKLFSRMSSLRFVSAHIHLYTVYVSRFSMCGFNIPVSTLCNTWILSFRARSNAPSASESSSASSASGTSAHYSPPGRSKTGVSVWVADSRSPTRKIEASRINNKSVTNYYYLQIVPINRQT